MMRHFPTLLQRTRCLVPCLLAGSLLWSSPVFAQTQQDWAQLLELLSVTGGWLRCNAHGAF